LHAKRSTRARARTHTHTHTHTYTQAHTYACTQAHIRAWHVCLHACAHLHAHTLSCMHTYTHTHTCIHTHTRTGHNSRDVAQIALVNQYEQVILNLYIRPQKPVVSHLTPLTGQSVCLQIPVFLYTWYTDTPPPLPLGPMSSDLRGRCFKSMACLTDGI
jgi:hypothetical protein